MLEKVRKELFEFQDIDYQVFQSNLCPGIDNIIGVRVPEIRKIAKKLLKEDYKRYIEVKDKKYYEEIMLEGLLIALSKIPIDEKIKYLDKFIPKIDNWAICDICASSFKLTDEQQSIMWNYLLKYHKSTREFELRFMIVMWMNHYLTSNYHSNILEYIDQITSDHYYVKMSIAWLISIDYINNKEEILKYLKDNNLSDWTYNKALQKMIESTRLSKEEKQVIRKMKRNKK